MAFSTLVLALFSAAVVQVVLALELGGEHVVVERWDEYGDAVVDDRLDVEDEVLLLQPADHRRRLGPRRPVQLVEHLVDPAGGERAEAHHGRALEQPTPADVPLLLFGCPLFVVRHGSAPPWPCPGGTSAAAAAGHAGRDPSRGGP
jgi:hypothetical protein